jgi:hypothetical protein
MLVPFSVIVLRPWRSLSRLAQIDVRGSAVFDGFPITLSQPM